MENLEWRDDGKGTFVAMTVRFRLMVCRVADCRYARFLVLARHGSVAGRLIGSGTAVNVGQGMQKAQIMAERFLDGSAFVGPLVMVVDDNDAVRDISADVLLDAGYLVEQAASGEGALRRLESTAPPVILVADIDLGGGMSGLELAATIRQLWPTMGVLLVSGGDKLAACEAAGEEFLAKPFSIDQLLDRITSIARRIDRSVQPTAG